MKRLFKHPFLLAFLIALPVIAASMFSGPVALHPADLFHPDEMQYQILMVRLLRTGQGFLVGGALALAGAACQAVLRNPLADPYILGVSGGASVGAATMIATGLASVSSLFLPGGAFAGGPA